MRGRNNTRQSVGKMSVSAFVDAVATRRGPHNCATCGTRCNVWHRAQRVAPGVMCNTWRSMLSRSLSFHNGLNSCFVQKLTDYTFLRDTLHIFYVLEKQKKVYTSYSTMTASRARLGRSCESLRRLLASRATPCIKPVLRSFLNNILQHRVWDFPVHSCPLRRTCSFSSPQAARACLRTCLLQLVLNMQEH
jgi:hypothetical protein